ncbi:MAG TPA: tetraacyldisaccharide 4'-kinase [candidate division Zixibacteria bacterium]|nr:tetraacyldisaccharide 4'-kinase [candidate division Zixibacteria bacterium]
MLEAFWKRVIRRKRFGLLSLAAIPLYFVSLLYRLGYRWNLRRQTSPEKVAVPVISVGNISVGGTGKTPTVAMLAERLITEGIRVGVVSSGYGRERHDINFIESGHQVATRPESETGDEVHFLSSVLPEAIFSINRRKVTAARDLAATGEVDVIIVDDGFQHRALARDLDIVTFDAAVKPRMLRIFPYGVLREPIQALERADIVILTRTRFAKNLQEYRNEIKRVNPHADQYLAHFVPQELIGREERRPLKYLEDKSVFLFAGVGNFRPLRKQVQALSADLDAALELSDHQRYDRALLERIRKQVDKLDSDVILTTGKDWTKLAGFDFGREIYYLSQSVDLDPGEEKLLQNIIERLNLPQRTA